MDDVKKEEPIKKTWKERLLPLRPMWKNFWFDSWQSAFVFFFVIFMSWAFMNDTAQYREVASNPCDYCSLVQHQSAMQGGGVWEQNFTGTVWPQNGLDSTRNVTS